MSAAEIMAEMVKDFIADVTNEDGEVTRSGRHSLLISSTDSNGKPPKSNHQ
jgi:hypothetical protein